MSTLETKASEQQKAQSDSDSQIWKIFGNNASADFLSELRGNPVIVSQATGIEYRGTLHAVDGFLNVVLKNTKEVFENTVVSELGEVFLRGSSVDYIAAA